ncbi:MAG: hypothetical protein V1904_11900 [Bacteroidota bacterium]
MKGYFIDFRQQRDFGETLNATFAFFRLNIGKLGKAMLFYTCPFLLIQGVARVYYDLSFTELTSLMIKQGPGVFFTRYFITTFVLLITAFFSSLMTNLTVYSYIKLYAEKGKDGFVLEEVWGNIKRNLLRIGIASFISGIIVLSGCMMCGIPGVYLFVSTSFVIMIMIYEGKAFRLAFKRSFALVHYHWWAVFLMLLVIYVIMNIVSLLFTIPQLVINSFYKINSLNPNYDNELIMYVMIMLTMLSTLAYGFLYSIMHIALSFQYFSFIEQKESPRLNKEIEAMEQG